MISKLYNKYSNPYLVIIFLTILSTLILWSPFIFKLEKINGVSVKNNNFETVIKNWDGPLYIIAAKTLYDPTNPILENRPLGLQPKYFAAHLPLYPLTIKTFATFFGYPKAILTSTVAAAILLYCFFYYFLKKLRLTEKPFLLTIVFMFIFPRILVVRSVGTPEPLFILLILLSIYFFINKKYLFSGLFGGLAAMTKSPALLLFISYALFAFHSYVKTRKFEKGWLYIFLIPAGLLLVFLFYQIQIGDFFAYFHSGDNLHLVFPPFSIFNLQKIWVNTVWLEDIIFYYFFYLLVTLEFKKEKNIFFYITLVFFISILFVQHRDIARYSLPALPVALIAFERFFTSKKFMIALVILIPAIYLYSWNFMIGNQAPITDWLPFL